MKIDKNAVDSLLALDDAQLSFLINHMAQRVGLDLDSFGIRGADIATVRRRLASISDEELERASRQINGNKKN